MVSAARVWGLAAAGAILLMAGVSADPASAQGDVTCRSDVITVTGRSKGGIKRWTQEQELKGEGAAMTDAVEAWQRKVGDRFGEPWKLWSSAKDKSFNCERARGIALMGVACTVRGRPCALKTALADDDKGGGRPKSYSRDDDDDDAGWPRGYRREMERQERLKNQRDRAEARALEREEARQRYLAQRRDRREGQRQRYYDDDDD